MRDRTSRPLYRIYQKRHERAQAPHTVAKDDTSLRVEDVFDSQVYSTGAGIKLMLPHFTVYRVRVQREKYLGLRGSCLVDFLRGIAYKIHESLVAPVVTIYLPAPVYHDFVEAGEILQGSTAKLFTSTGAADVLPTQGDEIIFETAGKRG